MRKSSVFIIAIFCTILFLSIVQVTVSNNLSTSGLALAKLEDQIDVLERENALLEEKFLTLSSLTHLASSAAKFGFMTEKAQVYLGAPVPVAKQ